MRETKGVRLRTPPATMPDELDADIVVVGLGPAGVAAAARAAEAGQRVVAIDSAPDAGGQIWRHRPRDHLGATARRWLDRLARSGARLLHGASVVDVVGAGGPGPLTVVTERHRDGGAGVVHARALVIAAGARERFVPFPGWTLPGVVGVGGAQALLKQGASVTGKRVVIAGTGPLMLPVAASLSRAGARVRLVAEQAPRAAVRDFAASLVRHPGTLVQAAIYRLSFLRAPYATGTWVTEAAGTDRIEEALVSDGLTVRRLPCDLLCTGYGLVPNIELSRLVDCATAGGSVVVDGTQRTTVPGIFAAGEVTGIGGVALALVEGEIAGAAAAGVPHPADRLVTRRAVLREMAVALDRAFTLRAELRAVARDDTIICRCEDVRRASLAALGNARQARLHTRAGMGACQARVCGPALELLFGWPQGTVRPPLEPARLSTLVTAGASAAGPAPPSVTSLSSSES